MAQESSKLIDSSPRHEFLYREYELCFQQLRYYDSRQNDLLKYLVALATSVAAAQFAIFKFFRSVTDEFFFCLTFLATVMVVASLLIHTAMLQNRLYFTFTARQLNAIRAYLLANAAPDFEDNQLWTSADVAAFNLFSVHSFMLAGSSVLVSLSAAISAYSISSWWAGVPSWVAVATAFAVAFLLVTVGGAYYLGSQGRRRPDCAQK